MSTANHLKYVALTFAVIPVAIFTMTPSFAQTPPPPTTTDPAAALSNQFPPNTLPGTQPNSQPSAPFNVQLPSSQNGLPAGVMPGSQSTQGQVPNMLYIPMALPPSSGGFNPNTGGSSGGTSGTIVNPYNRPTNSVPRGATQPTRSEIITFNPKTESKTVLVVKTSEGEFKITLKRDIAPRNVENFIDLALGQKEFIDIRTGKKVKRPFYTGLNCHRVLKSVIIQCGCPFGNGTGGPGYRIPDERSTAMRFDRPGVVAMALARTTTDKALGYEPNSAGSQFFISLAPLPDYNGQFTVIGNVTSGMDTIRKIAETPTGPTDRPLKRVIIFSIDPDLPPLTPTDPMAAPMSPSTGGSGTVDPFAVPPPTSP